MRKIKSLAALALVSIFLGGCASTGSGEFSCSGVSEGVNCSPASDLYNLVDKPGFEDGVTEVAIKNHRNSSYAGSTSTHKRNDLSRRGAAGRPASKGAKRDGNIVPDYFGREPIIPAGDPDYLMLLTPPAADTREPLRTQAVQQRVWVAPWVSNGGVWHGQQVIYLEVAAREWQNGIIGSEPAMPIFRPLD